MRIFVSATPVGTVDMARVLAVLRDGLGHEVVSRWAFQGPEPVRGVVQPTPELSRQSAHRCIEDIVNSEAMLVFTEDSDLSGVRHIELGIALLRGVYQPNGYPIVLIGPLENVYQSLENIHHFDSWSDFLDVLAQARRNVAISERECPRWLLFC